MPKSHWGQDLESMVGVKKLSFKAPLPLYAQSCNEVRLVKNSLLHLYTIKSSGNWFAAYVLRKRRTLSAADHPLTHKNCTIMRNSTTVYIVIRCSIFTVCAFMLYWSSHPEICTVHTETQIFLFPIVLLHNVAVLPTCITLGITFGTPFVVLAIASKNFNTFFSSLWVLYSCVVRLSLSWNAIHLFLVPRFSQV